MKLGLHHFFFAGLLFVLPAGAATAPNVVLIRIEADGSFELNGVRYSDPNIFKTKLAEMEKRKPAPQLSLVAPHATSLKTVARAITLFQEAGIPKFGVLMEPDDLPAKR